MNPAMQNISRISDSDRDQYWRNGFVIARDVFAHDEIESMCTECDRLFRCEKLFEAGTPGIATRKNVHGETFSDRLDPVIEHSPLFKKLAFDERLLTGVASLLGHDANLFKDRLILKPPGVTGYGIHQDHSYWEWTKIPADAMVTVQIALDASDAESGAVKLYPAMHNKRLPPAEDDPRDVDASALGDQMSVTAVMQPGDLLLFHSRCPHSSDANRSDHPRRTIYFIYNDVRYGDRYAEYYAQRTVAQG